MKKLLLTTIVLGLSVAASGETSDEAAVRAAHEAFVNAAKAGDGAALNKLLADGVQYSHSNTKLETKQEAIAALVKSKGNFQIHEQTIHVYGKAATIRAKMTAKNPAGDINLTMLQVWIKNGNQWQMIERHTTRLPAQ